MRFVPFRMFFSVAISTGLLCIASALIGCEGSTPPAATTEVEAKPSPTTASKPATGKPIRKLKNISPKGELGVRELRALKKAQQSEKAE